MIPQRTLVRCLLFPTLLFGLTLTAPRASAQSAESFTSSVESVTIGSGSTITLTCTISNPQHEAASDFADDISVSGPDDFGSGGGSAVADGSSTVVVTHEMAVPDYVGTYTGTCLGLEVKFTVTAAMHELLYSKCIVACVTSGSRGDGSGGMSTVQYGGTTTTKTSSSSNGGPDNNPADGTPVYTAGSSGRGFGMIGPTQYNFPRILKISGKFSF